MGAWYMLPMPDESDRMQAVHAAVLPNNKVLIVNGSSNRNRVTVDGKIEDGVNTKDYDVVNNTSIFDPSLSDLDEDGEADFTTSPFERIESPDAEINGESNDLFCSGHLQLPNGDVLFIGGTRQYYPGVHFSGSKQANVFHWNDNTWENLGLTQDGHWYPTLVPLADGAIASFSGFTADPSQQISTLVEIYDPNNNSWQAIDVKNLPNSPFVTRMNDVSYGSDIIDLYARILPTKQENRFLITGDGGGKNEPKIAHASVHSYFVTFNKDDKGEYSISFEPGPNRKAINKVYGTGLLDPSSPNGDVLLLGGIMGTNNIGIGPGKDVIEGATIVSSLERWKAPENQDGIGEWEIDEGFLGQIDEDILLNTEDIVAGEVQGFPLKYQYVKQESKLGRYGKRAMEQAVILPTKEILVVNGGNYAETRPAYNPTLLIPDEEESQGFRTKLMNPDIEPRLYHNTALLLPDARVLVMGGNNSRAARFVEDGTVRLDTKNDFAFVEKGTDGNSGEIWQHAIFYPPYLFGSSERSEITNAPTTMQYGATETISVNNVSTDEPGSIVLVKFGSVTHSFDNGQRLVDLQIDNENIQYLSSQNATIPFTAPSNEHFTPPGYYMLFYLNSVGKPSHAKIVQLVNS
ncbi:MAG: galactose oxidase early set domain-containing protein [Cyanobacteria bacterium J06635_10]